jgi:hypothetical protein
MASVAAPSGAEPVGTLSASGSFTGKVRHIKIASGYSVDTFYGDFVKLASGTIEKAVITNAVVPGTVGIFMGCAYTDPSTKQPTFSQYWPASTVATDAVAYVCDDPNLLFRMQGNGTLGQSALGLNCSAVSTAGSTDLGRSKNAVDAGSAADTATLPLRIVDFVDGPDSAVGDSFTDVIVTWVPGSHAYETALGVA